MNQAKIEKNSKFAARTEVLAFALKRGLDELPPLIKVSPATFYAGRNSDSKVSEKTWRKLEEAEAAAGIADADSSHKAAAPYGNASVARAKIEARFQAFLDAAEKVPGGMNYADITLRLHLDPDRLRLLDPTYDPAAELRRLAGESGGEVRRNKAG